MNRLQHELSKVEQVLAGDLNEREITNLPLLLSDLSNRTYNKRDIAIILAAGEALELLMAAYKKHHKERTNTPMPKSLDQIEFRPDCQYTERQGIVKVCMRAFDLDQQTAYDIVANGGTIRCRPSQFARFLIWRMDVVAINGFKNLKPKLLSCRVDCVTDVTQNKYKA